MLCGMETGDQSYPRNLDDEFKLSYRSIAEVYEAFGRIETMVGVDRSIRFKKRVRPKGAAILNALILHIASRPPEEQRAMIRDGMGRLNDLLRGDPRAEPGPPPGGQAEAPPGGAGGGASALPRTALDDGPGSVARRKPRNGNHG